MQRSIAPLKEMLIFELIDVSNKNLPCLVHSLRFLVLLPTKQRFQCDHQDSKQSVEEWNQILRYLPNSLQFRVLITVNTQLCCICCHKQCEERSVHPKERKMIDVSRSFLRFTLAVFLSTSIPSTDNRNLTISDRFFQQARWSTVPLESSSPTA
jgi:hypothetical protein